MICNVNFINRIKKGYWAKPHVGTFTWWIFEDFKILAPLGVNECRMGVYIGSIRCWQGAPEASLSEMSFSKGPVPSLSASSSELSPARGFETIDKHLNSPKMDAHWTDIQHKAVLILFLLGRCVKLTRSCSNQLPVDAAAFDIILHPKNAQIVDGRFGGMLHEKHIPTNTLFCWVALHCSRQGHLRSSHRFNMTWTLATVDGCYTPRWHL